MSIALTHSLLGGVPLLVLLVLAVLIFRHKGPHPATYKLSEEWTHAPILWAADERFVLVGSVSTKIAREWLPSLGSELETCEMTAIGRAAPTRTLPGRMA